ncbi:uncharacterized protein Dana_GF27200 [Drosophila ananassae]|uniref:Uncharacterized protein n=1 Tax=Drosophila ananassae TaxID=7217 RepID=A0A0N8NZU5_DROAN|nr:uncharacterized protein Dana_GF27200 [Drosophila ananassae]
MVGLHESDNSKIARKDRSKLRQENVKLVNPSQWISLYQRSKKFGLLFFLDFGVSSSLWKYLVSAKQHLECMRHPLRLFQSGSGDFTQDVFLWRTNIKKAVQNLQLTM